MDKKLKEELRRQGRAIASVEHFGNKAAAAIYQALREMMVEVQKGYEEEKACLPEYRTSRVAGHGEKPDSPRPKPKPRPQKR